MQSKYNLRSRDQLNPPDRYGNNMEEQQRQLISQTKRQRNGKATGVDLRVKTLQEILAERGSRTKLKILSDELQRYFHVATTLHEKYMLLLPEDHEDYSDSWIEELGQKVECCIADVRGHLEERKDEAPSSDCSSGFKNIKSWVDESVGEKVERWQENNSIDRENGSLFSPQEMRVTAKSFVPSNQSHGLQLQEKQLHNNEYVQNGSYVNSGLENYKQKHIDERFTHAPSMPKADVAPKIESTCYPEDAKPPVTDLVRARNPTAITVYSQHKAVDQWIDELNERIEEAPQLTYESATDVSMKLLAQQRLPRTTLKCFNGSAGDWIEFVLNFREMVHDQSYLTVNQKKTYLMQHTEGEAKKSISGFGNDWYGYVMSLKRLKYVFGQRIQVAQSILQKVTKGKQFENNDVTGITEFYYGISNCINTLSRMCYTSDLYSSDVLRQVLRRLPHYLKQKWVEYSFRLRKTQEPSLIHLESWLQDRVMALKDPYCPYQLKSNSTKSKHSSDDKFTGHTKTRSASSNTTSKKTTPKNENATCEMCNGSHKINKCKQYFNKTGNERLSVAVEKGLCFNCLGKHLISKCPSKGRCFQKSCKKRHHTSLHDAFVMKEKKECKDEVETKEKVEEIAKDSNESNESSQNKQKPLHVGVSSNPNQLVYLQVIPVKLANGNHTIETHALLDSGSQSTLIKRSVADALSLKGVNKCIKLAGLKDEGEVIKTKLVQFEIISKCSESKFDATAAYVINDNQFHLPSQNFPVEFATNADWKPIRDLGIKEVKSKDIGLLIGADIPAALIITQFKATGKNKPHAVQTPFGWALMGPMVKDVSDGNTHHIHHIRTESSLENQVHAFWETESFGTKYDFQQEVSTQDRVQLQKLQRETVLKDGKYVVPMLWNSDTNFPESKEMAEKRLNSLFRRFQKNPAMFEMYKRNIEDYLENGYACVINDVEKDDSLKKWYLPHHAVINPNKPGKVRTVFDAAATVKGQSLNKKLCTGPDLLNNLVGILIRFRIGSVAIAADIEAMYHQVRLKDDDTDAVRFLWKESIDGPLKHLKMLVHIFGATDSPCCASYALRRTVDDNESKFSKEVVDAARNSFYMDDLMKSTNNEESGYVLATELRQLMKLGGFNLVKFISNSNKLMKRLPKEILARPVDSIFIENSEEGKIIERVLGVKWNLSDDTFTFTSSPSKVHVTKRGILSVASSIFDPLGFIAPFVVRAKIILQELWRIKVGWDDEVPENIKNQWIEWLDELKHLPEVSVARQYGPEGQYQLHIFCDASELAFAAVAYLRILNNNDVTCSLLMSKSRLAPLKVITLPRLELQAAVLAVRLKIFIMKEINLKIEYCRLWTDSTIVLQYLNQSSKRFKTFVANRIAEILDYSTVEEWSHVPGSLNPADWSTRGMKIRELMEKEQWFNGPNFLYEEEENWPKCDLGETDKSNLEFKTTVKTLNTKTQNETDGKFPFLRFSSWRRMVNVVARILRLSRKNPAKSDIISITERKGAEEAVIKILQLENFGNEIQCLKNGTDLEKGSKLNKLNPFIDEKGILRVGGRIKNAQIPYASKHQIILYGKCHAVKLLIEYTHKYLAHGPKEQLMAELRRRFWIIGCRQMIKTVIHWCRTCMERNMKPARHLMADLPLCRLAISAPPFFHTGVDYFGPLEVKIFRRRVKRWGCIFCCMTTRAVHLEVSPSLESDDFINTLHRFLNRRGCPGHLYSDNGTNFRGADHELKLEIQKVNARKVEEFAAKTGFEWHFNPPEAPHMGGAWERLIQGIKRTLKVILNARVLDDYSLNTFFTEAENIANNRPLTTVSEDIDDLEPISPNHFLMGRANTHLPVGIETEVPVSHRKRWKMVQLMAEHFWKRWKMEYLQNLTERCKWTKEQQNFKEGDLILFHDPKSTKGNWSMGRIHQIYPGKDGRVRVVDVKTAKGIYERPITNLYRLPYDG